MTTPAPAHWRGMRVIARGANRVCVHDPELPGHCLKFELAPVAGMRRYWRRMLRHALSRRLPRFGLNRIELDAYRRLHRRFGDAVHAHVAPCLGIVATAAGPALRCRLVTDDDGRIASSVHDLLLGAGSEGLAEAVALCRALDELEAWLLAHRIALFDLNAGNLVVAGRAGRPVLIAVDVKSTLAGREPIPLSRWSQRLMRHKIQRRCLRLRQRIEAAAPGPVLATGPTLL